MNGKKQTNKTGCGHKVWFGSDDERKKWWWTNKEGGSHDRAGVAEQTTILAGVRRTGKKPLKNSFTDASIILHQTPPCSRTSFHKDSSTGTKKI